MTTNAPPKRMWRWLLVTLPVALLMARSVAAVVDLSAVRSQLAPTEAVVQVVLAGLGFIAAIALLAGRRIGWLLALSIVGWDLAASIVLWWIGAPSYLSMALLAAAALLITSRDMRIAFEGGAEPSL